MIKIKKLVPAKPLLILLFLNIILYIPSLFEPVSYGDECIYLVLGNAFRKGLVFYRDIHDNKPPLLYLTAALGGGSLFWFRLISIITSLIHIDLVFNLIKKTTKSKYLPFFGGAIFSVLLLIFEGRVANGEVFMAAAATLAVYLLLTRPEKNNFSWGLVIGAIFSIGFLYKIPIAFDFVGIVLATFLLTIKSISKKSILSILKDKKLWGMIAGFSLPILLSIIYYTTKGAFTPYVRSALMQNIGYLSSWQGEGSELFTRLKILTLLTIITFIARKIISKEMLFFFTWFTFSLFGALLSGRPYPHYLIESSPSIAILVALLIDKLFKLKSTVKMSNPTDLLLPLVAVGLLIFSHNHYQFWRYPQLSYYQNFVNKLVGAKTNNEYVAYWGDRALENQKLAKFIKETTLPDDRIFVWGEASCTYALSNRLPPGRYMVNYHIFDFNGYEETLNAIDNKKPKLIIKMKDEERHWPELDLYLEENYLPMVSDQLEDRIFLLNRVNSQ